MRIQFVSLTCALVVSAQSIAAQTVEERVTRLELEVAELRHLYDLQSEFGSTVPAELVGNEHLRWGYPGGEGELLVNEYFVTCHNNAHRVPEWVSYHLTDDNLMGDVERTDNFRPAPELSKIRALADLLHLNMADLLVAAGTSREVMEHLLWSERLKSRRPPHDPCCYLPATWPFVGKNAFRVRVLRRDRALCVIALGGEELTVLSFISDEEFVIRIPPEMVMVYRRKSHAVAGSAENMFSAQVKKVRQLGQVANLVLSCKGFELNTLHSQRKVMEMDVRKEERVFVVVQATAIQAFPIQSEEDDSYEA